VLRAPDEIPDNVVTPEPYVFICTVIYLVCKGFVTLYRAVQFASKPLVVIAEAAVAVGANGNVVVFIITVPENNWKYYHRKMLDRSILYWLLS
jgi:hypothetical protein